MSKDLGEEIENVEEELENLKNKDFLIFGIRMTPMTLGAAFAGISTILGSLYAGFLMYQKVEEVANLDVGAYEQKMELIDQKLNNQQKLLSSIESNLNDAKTNMYRIDTKVSDKLNNYDTKLDRFENKVEKTKVDLEEKIQKALDNPLANQ
jgi:uncharacterized protein YukE